MKITMLNLEGALLLVPKYIVLTPGVDLCEADDEVIFSLDWKRVLPHWVNKAVSSNTRRPIPEKVRENMAFWLYRDFLSGGYPINEADIEKLGGADAVTNRIREGNLFNKWRLGLWHDDPEEAP